MNALRQPTDYHRHRDSGRNRRHRHRRPSPSSLEPIEESSSSRRQCFILDRSESPSATARCYERTRIHTLTAERETVQKKTFTKWANTVLKCSQDEIHDLFVDLRDGRVLLKLLEKLSGEDMSSSTPGHMRIHCLENVDKSLYFLTQLGIHMENIGAHDIVDGNQRITLGLLWLIILRFQIQDISLSHTTIDQLGSRMQRRRHSKDALLLWCKAKTADYVNVNVQDFTASWRDGLAFNALIHRHRPDLINYGSLSPNTPLQNLESAFLVAEHSLSIPRLFDPEDIYVQQPDERSILTYVASYYHFFSQLKQDCVANKRIGNFINFLHDAQSGAEGYEQKTSNLLTWIFHTIEKLNNRQFPNNLPGLQDLLNQFNQEYRLKEKIAKIIDKNDLEIDLFQLRSRMRAKQMRVYRPSVDLQVNQVNRAWTMLEKAEHECESALREELKRQQRLVNLFSRLCHKAELRKTRIGENLRLVDNVDPLDHLKACEVAMKKHEALQTDVNAYRERVDAFFQLADELELQANFDKTQEVAKLKRDVESQWNLLLDKMSKKSELLRQRWHFLDGYSEYNRLQLLIDDASTKLTSMDNNSCSNILQCIEMLQKQAIFEAEILSIGNQMSALGLGGRVQSPTIRLGDDSLRFRKETNLRDSYSQLLDQLKCLKSSLERDRDYWQLLADFESQIEAVDCTKHRLQVMLDPDKVYKSPSQLKLVKAIEGEVERHRLDVEQLFARWNWLRPRQSIDRQSLIDRQHVNAINQSWQSLSELVVQFKQRCILAYDLEDFCIQSADLLDWFRTNTNTCFTLIERLNTSADELLNDSRYACNIVRDIDQTFPAIFAQCKEVCQLGEFIEDGFRSDKDLTRWLLATSKAGQPINDQDYVSRRLSQIARADSDFNKQFQELRQQLTDRSNMRHLYSSIDCMSHLITGFGDRLTSISSKAFPSQDLLVVEKSEKDDSSLNYDATTGEKIERAFKEFELFKCKMMLTEQVNKLNQEASQFIQSQPKGVEDESHRRPLVDKLCFLKANMNTRHVDLTHQVDRLTLKFDQLKQWFELTTECREVVDWIGDKILELNGAKLIDPTSSKHKHYVGDLCQDVKAVEARVEDVSRRLDSLMRIDPTSNSSNSGSNNEWQGYELLTYKQVVILALHEHDGVQQAWKRLKGDLGSELQQYLGDQFDSKSGKTPIRVLEDQLNQFETWFDGVKNLLCAGIPVEPSELEKQLIVHQQTMDEFQSRKVELEDLISKEKSIHDDGHPDASLATSPVTTQRLESLKDELTVVGEALVERENLLRLRYNTHYFFTEVAQLKATLNHHASILESAELPVTLESVISACKKHEGVEKALATSWSDRVDAIVDLGQGLTSQKGVGGDKETIVNEYTLLTNKFTELQQTVQRWSRTLTCTQQLYEFYAELEDFEDWMSDKNDSLKATQQALESRPRSGDRRLRAIQDEIESNRERGNRILEAGKNLPLTDEKIQEEVGQRLDQFQTKWDQLVFFLHGLLDSGHKDLLESQVGETVQQIITFLDPITPSHLLATIPEEAEEDASSFTLEPIQAKMNELDQQLTQLDEYQKLVESIQSQLAIGRMAPPNSPEEEQQQNKLRLMLDNLIERLTVTRPSIVQALDRLQGHETGLRDLLDLTLELAWVKDKRQQLDNLADMIDSSDERQQTTSSRNRRDGSALMTAQRLERRLTSHALEVANRRPRAKLLCDRVEKQYLTNQYDNTTSPKANKIDQMIHEIRGSWASVGLLIDRLQREVDLRLDIHRFLLDAGEFETWISEQELYLLVDQNIESEQSVMTARKRLNSRLELIDHRADQINPFKRTGEALLGRLLQHSSNVGSGFKVERPEFSNWSRNSINSSIKRIDSGFANLVSLGRESRASLEAIWLRETLKREANDLEVWIAERSVIASKANVGSDLDHCWLLYERLIVFGRATTNNGSRRIADFTSRCVQLIGRVRPGDGETTGSGSGDFLKTADLAAAKDRVSDAWADLMELIQTRKQLLTAALDMYRFLNDCQDLEERLAQHAGNLPNTPTRSIVTGQSPGLALMRRKSDRLTSQLLSNLSQQVQAIDKQASALLPCYAGGQEEQLRTRHSRVGEAWHRLSCQVDGRRGQLEAASALHDFLVTAKDLIEWLETVRDKMESVVRPSDIAGIEALIDDHLALNNDIKVKSTEIDTCLNQGRHLLEAKTGSLLFGPRDPMTGPRGEVRERCVQLATGKLLVAEFWRERWDRLHMLLEIRHYAHDANSAESWLATRELHLAKSRRSLGESVGETLSLLGAHYAFERTLTGAEDRFNALKRLTTLEVRAIEWTPEEGFRREQDKRSRIREAVAEFLPDYIKSSTKLSPTDPNKSVRQSSEPRSQLPKSTTPTMPREAAISQRSSTVKSKPTQPSTVSTPSSISSGSTTPSERKVEPGQDKLPSDQQQTPKPAKRKRSGKRLSSTNSQPQSHPQLPKEQDLPTIIKRDSLHLAINVDHRISPDHLDSTTSTGESTSAESDGTKTPGESVTDSQASQHDLDLDKTPTPGRRHRRSRTQNQTIRAHKSQLPPTGSDQHRRSRADRASISSTTSRSSIASQTLTTNATTHRVEEVSENQPTTSQSVATPSRHQPRLEGPVVRKIDVVESGSSSHSSRRSLSRGRSWFPLYIVLDVGFLHFYKDQATARNQPTSFFRNEPPVKLDGSSASTALDYSKRPCVFRLRLASGCEYLFQTANDTVSKRWVEAMNQAASTAAGESIQHTSSTDSTTVDDRLSQRAGSRAESPSGSKNRRRSSLKRFLSIGRKKQ